MISAWLIVILVNFPNLIAGASRGYTEISITPWEPLSVKQNVQSKIHCAAACLINTNCTSFFFDSTNSICEIGNPTNFTVDLVNGKLTSIDQAIDTSPKNFSSEVVVIVNDFNRNAIGNVSVTIQSGWQLKYGITDSLGRAIVDVPPFSNVTVSANASGYIGVSFVVETTNETLQDIRIVMSPLLNGSKILAGLMWHGNHNQLDSYIKTMNCSVYYSRRSCLVFNDTDEAYIYHDYDGYSMTTSFNKTHTDPLPMPETMRWEGTFPVGEKHVVFVENYGQEPEFYATRQLLFLYQGEQSVVIKSSENHGGNPSANVWIAGCMDPSMGIASFVTLNLYQDVLGDVSLCA